MIATGELTVSMQERHTLVPLGPFSLEESARFGFGQRHDRAFDGTMRLAFTVDGYAAQAGVALTQGSDGSVEATITGTRGNPDPAAVIAQAARVLSLDHDARGFVAVGDRDPVVARLLAAAPGLRPPLFYSPYEAAFWAVLSARRPAQTAGKWRQAIARAGGEPFDVAGTALWALPTPATVLDMGPDGLQAAAPIERVRAERVYGVAQAAWEGRLGAATLAQAEPDQARRQLRAIPGIGPFYADLILLRSTGATDILTPREPRLLALIGELYELGGPATPAQAEEIALPWAPWRTWVSVLVRVAGPRVLGRPDLAG